MRAAVIERFGEPPVVRDKDEPPADSAELIEVTAAPLNPVDLSIASGRFYGGTPPLPYVPGGEGIGHPKSAASATETPIARAFSALTPIEARLRPGPRPQSCDSRRS